MTAGANCGMHGAGQCGFTLIEVMVVLLLPAYALIANHRLAGLHALDQPQPLQLLEDPVHACAAHPALLSP